MQKKLQSEIIRINLDDATYKNTNAYIEPTYVNFFFGNNGAGKSTIAKAIQNGIGIIYTDKKTSADYLPLVFNQEFIGDNFHSYDKMLGVFTLNRQNVKIQQQITERNAEYINLQKKWSDINTDIKQHYKSLSDMKHAFETDCLSQTSKIRAKFPLIIAGKKKPSRLAEALLSHAPKDANLDELKQLYNSAYFSYSTKKLSLFPTITDIAVLDLLPHTELLSMPIVNSSETELAVFLKEIGATEWMLNGHECFSRKANHKCPYCGQYLPANFEELFIKSFDNRYQNAVNLLKDFLELYKNTAVSLLIELQNTPPELSFSAEALQYAEKVDLLKATIQNNLEKIHSKIEKPSITVTLEPTELLLAKLADIADYCNRIISKGNDDIDERPKKQQECADLVLSFMAFQLHEFIIVYMTNRKKLESEISSLKEQLDQCATAMNSIQEDLKQLQKNTVETETAKDKINQMLHDSGMQGFSLHPKQGIDHVYEVRRPDGTIATNLSEGEKNFIAFLYFYYLVHGSISEESDSREKIVVIDDPVSSMDSGSLFIVSTLIRHMIENCRNNADNRNAITSDNFIKQIFILTHNAYFHREITYSYVSKYEYVSFYLIRKTDSKSSIKLCTAINPNEPTYLINTNPVKSSYAALWDEYNEVKSSVALINVIRRILEYYFLQLCGYEGAQLRQVILVDGKASGFFKDKNGNDDNEKFRLAAAMLSYIDASTLGINDGMDFVEESINPDDCRHIFEMIFDAMNQKQHYNMMFRKSEKNTNLEN